MPYVPKAVCLECGVAMEVAKVGVRLEMIAHAASYYKIRADVYRCPRCGRTAAVNMASAPYAESYQPDYAAQAVDRTVQL